MFRSVAAMACLLGSFLFAQTVPPAGTIHGSVALASGEVIPGARVEIENPKSGFHATQTTGIDGRFTFSQVPLGDYQLIVSARAFTTAKQSVSVSSTAPVAVHVAMKLAALSTTVTVEATATVPIINRPVPQVDVSQQMISRLPPSAPGAGLSSVIINTTPGVVADSNGMFHPLGEHADTTFVVDGRPNSNQQSKIFANALPEDTIASLQTIMGVPPPAYGDKASLVVKVTTKSGLGDLRPRGSFDTSYGTFGTYGEQLTLGWGGNNWGNFLAMNAEGSQRYLDSPEFVALNDNGNDQNIFDRIDWVASARSALHIDFSAARAHFQVPNTYPQQAARQNQRQWIGSFDISPAWVYTINPNLLLNLVSYYSSERLQYLPSPNPFSDTPATVAQDRELSEAGLRAQLSYTTGIHDLEFGASVSQTPLTEAFQMGITDPAFAAGLPGLLPYDLTRGGTMFQFHGHTDIHQAALYAQDTLKLGNLSGMVGLRADQYRGLSQASALEPRLGISYLLSATQTVLQASYGRIFETPYNENLILSSATGAGGLASTVFGAFSGVPLKSGLRNAYDVGLQQAAGRLLSVHADYFWKFTSNAFDFDTLFNTPITFPIEWLKSREDGVGASVVMKDFHGFTARSDLGHTRSRFFGPEVGGIIFNSPLDTGVFRIDHDEAFEQTTQVQYQASPSLPWLGFTWRYDSGLVAGNVPDLASALALTGDEQAAIGFYCGSQVATLNSPITSCSRPYPQWGATRIVIPPPGTFNPDTNPPRVAPRSTFDFGVGDDNLFPHEHYHWTAEVHVLNFTNQKALYNFLSTFSGSHFAPPRSFSVKVGIAF